MKSFGKPVHGTQSPSSISRLTNSRSHRLRVLAVLAGCCVLGTAAQTEGKFVKEFREKVLKRVEVSGYRRLSLHSHRVTGDRDAYNTGNYYGQGQKKFTDIGQVDLRGRNVLGLFNFDATILDSRLNDPQGQKLSLDYKNKRLTVNAGDIYGSLINSNRYASYARSLRGVQGSYRTGSLTTKVLYTQARGTARTVSISGTNSSGPYFLQNNQIIRGSEKIQLDGQSMVAGTDYVIDYDSGSVTFLGRVVPPTSTIVASYEALGFGTKAGTVQGMGVTLNMGKSGRVGLTALQQVSRSGGQGSTRLEKFEGFGAPSTPYFLQFEPINTASVTIRVNGIVQAPGVDYRFDADNASVFYFNRFMAATDNIDVVYTPKPRTTVEGDRDVFGVDYELPLGKAGGAGSLKVFQALGRLKNTVTPSKGLARGASLDVKGGDALFTATYRDVPTGYVGIETVGFQRNEKAYDLGLDLTPHPQWGYKISTGNSVVGVRTSTTTGTVVRLARVTTAKASATFLAKTGLTWEARHERARSRLTSGDQYADTSSIFGTQRLGSVDLRIGLNRTTGGSNPVKGTPSTFLLDGIELATTYTFQRVLSLSGRVETSNVKVNKERAQGKDYELSASYSPSRKFTLSSRYALSDSGRQLTQFNFNNGLGIGFDGNGFSGGGETTLLGGASNLELFSVNSRYELASWLSLNGSYQDARTSGSVTSNSRTRSNNLNLEAQARYNHRLSVGYSTFRTTFVGSAQRSGTDAWSVYLDGFPPGRTSYSLGFSLFDTSGASSFSQDSTSLNANVGYRLAGRHSLFADLFSTRSTGYLPQTSFDLGLGYRYDLTRDLGLVAQWKSRRIRNSASQITSGAYSSNGFDLTLDVNFRP